MNIKSLPTVEGIREALNNAKLDNVVSEGTELSRHGKWLANCANKNQAKFLADTGLNTAFLLDVIEHLEAERDEWRDKAIKMTEGNIRLNAENARLRMVAKRLQLPIIELGELL